MKFSKNEHNTILTSYLPIEGRFVKYKNNEFLNGLDIKS